MPSKKNKSFKSSLNEMHPAMQFISKPLNSDGPAEGRPGKPPEGFKVNPLYVETKSRRLQLLVQPSLYNKLKARAVAEQRSVNELIHVLLDGALTQ